MERKLRIGDHVLYIDAHRVAHHALVTTVWEQMSGGNGPAGCNVVIVSGDDAMTDPYGRQIARFTSVVHKSRQPAGGWCWCWPDEWEWEAEVSD